MKIVFLFDQVDDAGKVTNAESIPLVVTPDKLNLRQLSPGLSSLGVVFEQSDDKGEKQFIFRQIINFPIDLAEPKPAATPEAPQGLVLPPSVPLAEVKVAKKSKKNSK